MQAKFVLDYDTIAVDQARKIYLLAHVTTEPAGEERQRRPLNLSLVIDRSGSMAGQKIDYTRQAAQFLVQNLGVNDVLSIVLYNDSIETLLPPEKVQRKDVINQRIATIKASGTTNLSGGWLAGCNLVGQNFSREYVNRAILMSDGHANRGVTSPDQLVGMARERFSEHQISTTTMGLGRDFNEDLLMAMAKAGGGAFYFIESPEVTPVIFQEELQGLLNVIGQNLMVSIAKSDHVASVTQMNAYHTHQDDERTYFHLGDVFGDEVKALLLELTIPPIKQVGSYQIATLRYEYDDLTTDGTPHRAWDVPVMLNVVSSTMPQLPDPDVTQSMLLLKAAQARQWAVSSADKGEYNTAANILRNVADAIDDADINNDALKDERTALLEQADEMEQGANRYDDYSRKMMATQAFYTMTSRHDDTMMLRVRELQRRGKDTSPEPQVNLKKDKPQDEIKVERVKDHPPTHVTWKGKTFALEGELIRIGRARHNEIVISANGVSRFHSQIRRDGKKLLIEDLGSTNGTIIAGNAITAPYELNVGDVIYLCDEKLTFHDEDKSDD